MFNKPETLPAENVPAKIAEAAVAQGQKVENILTQLAGNQTQQPDHLVVLMKESVDKIWSRNNLLQSSYLDEPMYFFEQKAIIIERWFINYYKNVTVEYTLGKSDKPPFYKITVKETQAGEHNEKFSDQFSEFNKDMLELTKARGGRGVQDLIKIFQSSTQGQVEQQRLSLMQRAGNWINGVRQ